MTVLRKPQHRQVTVLRKPQHRQVTVLERTRSVCTDSRASHSSYKYMQLHD